MKVISQALDTRHLPSCPATGLLCKAGLNPLSDPVKPSCSRARWPAADLFGSLPSRPSGGPTSSVSGAPNVSASVSTSGAPSVR